MSVDDLKCVVVGDGAVGKSALLMTLTSGTFPAEYIPTVVENFRQNISHKNKIYSLGLWDTAGQEDYKQLRTLSYKNTDVFILCFSVVNSASYDNIRHKWVPELSYYARDVPVVLCGTKVDLRTNEEWKRKNLPPGSTIPSYEQGKVLANEIGAFTYQECSAKTMQGVKELFGLAIDAVLHHRAKQETERRRVAEQKKTRCVLF